MAFGYSVSLRNAKLNAITAAIDAGAGAGILTIYDGVRPATGGAVTNNLATLTMGDPSFPAASAGSMTASAITGDTAADATGTATWFRITDSDANFVLDGDVGTSAADLILNSVELQINAVVNVTSLIIAAGNP